MNICIHGFRKAFAKKLWVKSLREQQFYNFFTFAPPPPCNIAGILLHWFYSKKAVDAVKMQIIWIEIWDICLPPLMMLYFDGRRRFPVLRRCPLPTWLAPTQVSA